MSQNQSGLEQNDLALRIAQRAMAGRTATYAGEVRRLLDAGLEVMRACGTASRPRVADIVAAAGLSNDAFYRHFPSKDALVAAILEDGAERLASYLAHQMGKQASPEGQVCAWVEGVLSQAIDDDIAASTLAVLWNAGSISGGLASGHSSINAPLAALLREPLAALGSSAPELDAALVAHATIGVLSDYLRRGERPSADDVEHIVGFGLGRVTPAPQAQRSARSMNSATHVGKKSRSGRKTSWGASGTTTTSTSGRTAR